MDQPVLSPQLKQMIANHLPRNIRRFQYHIYADVPLLSRLGIYIDPPPFEGKVVARTEEFIVVREARTRFALLTRKWLTVDPPEGSQVEVIPYARRNFEGRRIDEPKEEKHILGDQVFITRSVVLGGNEIHLPLPKVQCPELKSLIECLEKLPAPDRFRRISHLLVDACARDFSVVDPAPDDIIRTPPAVTCSVETSKFTGQLSIVYERGLDLYAIELRHNGELYQRIDQVYFDDLGARLEELIDDGAWRQIRVRILSLPKQLLRH